MGSLDETPRELQLLREEHDRVPAFAIPDWFWGELRAWDRWMRSRVGFGCSEKSTHHHWFYYDILAYCTVPATHFISVDGFVDLPAMSIYVPVYGIYVYSIFIPGTRTWVRSAPVLWGQTINTCTSNESCKLIIS